jgi:hypothetical protein
MQRQQTDALIAQISRNKGVSMAFFEERREPNGLSNWKSCSIKKI